MLIRKPTKQGIAYRFFQHRKRNYVSLCSLFFFPFDRPRDIETEQEMWPYLAGKAAPLPPEEGLPKGAAEVLVVGDCHAPGGKPVREAEIGFRLGNVSKRLKVTGPRQWKLRWNNLYQASAPEPFTALPVSWATAFGGAGFEENPLGLGFVPEELSAEGAPLPLVEYPDDPMRDPDSRPRPASLGPIAPDWPQRRRRAGTYDAAYLDSGQFPGLAPDTDFRAFNLAPADQWQKSWFAGDEPFEILNMHPERPHIRSRLPEIRARCFLRCRRDDGSLVFREVPQNLDTVWLFPGDLRGVVVFRGTAELVTALGEEIEHMLFAYERLGTPPRSAEHYEAELDLRVDPKASAALLTYDRGLKPEDEEEPPPDPRLVVRFKDLRRDPMAPVAALVAAQEQVLEAAAKDMGTSLSALREAAAAGAQMLPEVAALDELVIDFNRPETIDGDAIRARIDAATNAMKAQAEAHIAEAKAQHEALMAETRQRAAEYGIDYDAFEAEMAAKANRPVSEIWAEAKPKYFEANQPFLEYGQEYRDLFAELKQEADKVDSQVAELDALRREGERAMGHVLPLPAAPSPEQAAFARAALEEAMAKGAPLREQALAGLDLTGMDFSGRDMEEADFRGAILRNANFRGAKLARASFAQADIAGADFTGADLKEANLAKTAAAGTIFARADLANANCAEMSGPRAVLAGAVLNGTNLMKAGLPRADFSGATIEKISMMDGDLTGARFAEAQVTQCSIAGTSLAGADFTAAKLNTFLVQNGSLEGACFERAEIQQFGVQGESSLKGARFAGAKIATCSVAGMDLTGADFTGALADRVDFSECRIDAARFDRAVARSAIFTRARVSRSSFAGGNFSGSLWMEAQVSRTDFREAVLYATNFMRAALAENAFDKANVARSTLAGLSKP